ncbi:MAG: hypothetical protein QOK38_3714 [Acidobacteriaceae bacterium]|nr:hypothetical protein [Acidobacteriaceae bacterium]
MRRRLHQRPCIRNRPGQVFAFCPPPRRSIIFAEVDLQMSDRRATVTRYVDHSATATAADTSRNGGDKRPFLHRGVRQAELRGSRRHIHLRRTHPSAGRTDDQRPQSGQGFLVKYGSIDEREVCRTGIHRRNAGDGAVEIGRAILVIEPGGQAASQLEVKYVVYWQQEDSRWKWHVDIWNPNS